MSLIVTQSMWCNYRVISITANYVLDIWPTDNAIHGNEAELIAQTWEYVRTTGAAGMLLLGCDVAADPDDLEAMTAAVLERPADLHTGLIKLWPESTSRDDWMWSHRSGTLGFPAASQDWDAPVAYVSLGFLWVPARLLDLAAPVMASWRWGETDVRLSELALEHGIAAHAVEACRPKHLHFTWEHDGQVIARRSGDPRARPAQPPHLAGRGQHGSPAVPGHPGS